MEQSKDNLLDQLLSLGRALPTDKLVEVLDFAAYLNVRPQSLSRPERGSPQALLQHAGKFRFGPGELDQLLTDVSHMRTLDMEGNG